MRTVALSLLTSAALLVSAAQAAIPWQHELRTAHVKAQAEDKLLLLHFYTDNCVWCERLEEGAFQSSEVAQAIGQHFVPVKVHAAKNPKLAQMFQVTKFPTDVVVTTTGQTLSHSVSPQEAGRYAAMLSEAAAAHTPEGATRVAAASPSPHRQQQPQPADAGTPAASGEPAASLAAPSAAAQSRVASYRSPREPGSRAESPAAEANPYAAAAAPSGPAGTATAHLAGARTEGMTLQMPGQVQPRSQTQPTPQAPPASPQPQPGDADSAPAATGPQSRSLADATAAETSESESAQRPESEEPAGESAEASEEDSHELAMQGFCPVTVIEEDRWTEGKTELGVIHLGKLYLFATEEHRQTFLADPAPYTPVLNEIDVVRFFEERRIVPGKREWGLKDPKHNRMFFFADEAAMDHFWNEHERYTDAAIEVMEKAVRDANPGT